MKTDTIRPGRLRQWLQGLREWGGLLVLLVLVAVATGCALEEPQPAGAPVGGSAGQVEAPDTGRVRNTGADFSLAPGAGWKVMANRGETGRGGTIVLQPEGATSNQSFILTTVGLTELTLGVPDDGLSLDEMLDRALAGDVAAFDTTDREEVMVGGVTGLAIGVAGTDPEFGEMQGRVVVARPKEGWVFQMAGAATVDQWDRVHFDQVLDSVVFGSTAAPEAAEGMEPTEEPAESSDRPTPAVPGSEAVNEAAGFGFAPASGWVVAVNEEIFGSGGAVVLTPRGAAADTGAYITINAGAPGFVLGVDEEQITSYDSATLDDLLVDTFAYAQDITLSEPEDVTVDGRQGRAITISGSAPDLGLVGGRVVLVPLEGRRLLQVTGIGPVEQWTDDDFTATLESIVFLHN